MRTLFRDNRQVSEVAPASRHHFRFAGGRASPHARPASTLGIRKTGKPEIGFRGYARLSFWPVAAVMTGHTLGAIAGLWTPDMALALMALVGVSLLLWVGWASGPVDYGAEMRAGALRAALRTWRNRIGGH